MYKKLITSLAVAAATIITFAVNANSQTCPGNPGCLDPTFGTDGKVIFQPFGPNSSFLIPSGIAAQTDGKIVAVVSAQSSLKMVRLNSDGSFDTMFGVGGVVSFIWAVTSGSTTYYGRPAAVALQNVGGQERIVIAGQDSVISGRKVIDVAHIERFMPDGSVDTSFGTAGSVIINAGYAQHVAIQTDGKIVALSNTGNLIRLNVNGNLDPTFGGGGIVAATSGNDIALDASGGILLGGSVTVGKGNNARTLLTVKRYTSTGAADAGFGSSGVATADFGYSCLPWRLAIDPFGNIVASARVTINGSNHGAAARFTSTGFADTSFGGTGKVVLDSTSVGNSLVVQPDGKVVLTGKVNNDFGLVRFNYDGSLDTGFGNAGLGVADIYGDDYPLGTIQQNDPLCSCSKIVMPGGSPGGYTTFARFIEQ